MMNKTKKADTKWQMILSIIVGILTLVLLLMFPIKSMLIDSQYEQSLLETKIFVESLEGTEQLYFGEELNSIEYPFLQHLAKISSSKSLTLSSSNLPKGIQLMSECWTKMGAGDEFLGKSIIKKGVCSFCGTLELKDLSQEERNEFLDLIIAQEIFYEVSETQNLNKFLLNNQVLKNKITTQEKLGIYFYQGKQEDTQTAVNKVLQFGAQLFDTTQTIEEKYRSSNPTHTGLIVFPFDENLPQNLELCSLIVPEKNYE